MKFFENIIFKILYLYNICPNFIGSVHNFGKSNDDIFIEKVLLSYTCICGFMPNLYKFFWKVSTVEACKATTILKAIPPTIQKEPIDQNSMLQQCSLGTRSDKNRQCTKLHFDQI